MHAEKIYYLAQREVKNSYALMEWAHWLNCQLPNATMVILKLNIFLIPWKILLLNLFSVLCWLRTGQWCHEKFLVDNILQRVSFLYFSWFSVICVILWNFFNPFETIVSFLYPEKTLENQGFSMFSGRAEVVDWL